MIFWGLMKVVPNKVLLWRGGYFLLAVCLHVGMKSKCKVNKVKELEVPSSGTCLNVYTKCAATIPLFFHFGDRLLCECPLVFLSLGNEIQVTHFLFDTYDEHLFLVI